MGRKKVNRPQVDNSAIVSFPKPALRNAKEYLKAYTGYSYTAVSAIAQEVASIKIHLFEAKYVKGKPETKEIYEHEILSLLHYVNSLTTFYDLVEATQIYLELMGEAFWIVLKQGGTPREIWLVRPDWMKIIPDSQTVIKEYSYHPGGGLAGVKIPRENVVNFKYFNPLNPYRGKGSVQAAALPLDIRNFAQEYNRNFFFNSALPSMIFTTDQKLSDTTVRRFLQQWQSSFGGRSKSNKVAFLGNGLKLDQSVGGGAKELDFANQQKMMRDDILAIFKVPKTILGLTEDVNKANAEATTRAFMERVVTPRMRKFVETLNEFLVPMYGKGNLFLDFTDPSPEDVETKLKYYENASKWGWMTPNEIRAEENKPPIEGGDTLPTPRANPLGMSVPPAEASAGKNILNKLSKLFRDKEKEGVQLSHKEFKRKKFKHMVQIPVKRLEVLDREKLEKKLTPIVTEFIGDMLQKNKVENLGISSQHSHDISKTSVPRRVFTPELKDAYWKAFVKQAKEEEDTLYEEIVAIFRQQEKDVINNLNNNVRYWHKSLRKGKESSVIPSLREMILAWQAISILLRELVYRKGEQILDFLGIGGKLNLSTNNSIKYFKQKDLTIKEINEVTRTQLKETLANGFNQGESIALLTKRVQEVFKQATRNRARMIARTEALRASNFATLEGYRQSGIVKAQEWLAERDERTCEYCQEMDGKIIGLSDKWFNKGDTFAVNGNAMNIDYADVNHPPLHPMCRCTLIPVFEGEDISATEPSKVSVKDESTGEVVVNYQDGGYQTINGYLRGNKEVINELNKDKRGKALIKKRISKLSNLIEKQAKDDLYLFRGDRAGATSQLFKSTGISKELKNGLVSHNDYYHGKAPDGKNWDEYFNKKLVGQKFKDLGFVSTSRNKQIAEKFADSQAINQYGASGVITIRGQGIKAVSLDSFSQIEAEEQEYLLGRNHIFKVRNVQVEPVLREGYSGKAAESFRLNLLVDIVKS